MALLSDSVLSILALGVMNVVTQFAVYPLLNKVLGPETYGEVLYLISIVNILAVPVGCGANLARLVASVKGKTTNIDPIVWIVGMHVAALPVSFFAYYFSDMPIAFDQILLLWLLIGLTMWRNYADVEYRLSTNYKGYLLYYLCISIGYGAGIGLFYVTGIWQLILIPGEFAGLALVLLRGTILKRNESFDKGRFRVFFLSVISIAGANFMSNLVLNADRLVIKNMINGEAVTVYYIASLIGKTVAMITNPLNSVIISHLAKTKRELRSVNFLKLSLLGMALALVIAALCQIISPIFAKLLYPQEYEKAMGIFFLANLAQILYFASSILTTILLRYIKEVYQLVINIAYTVVFAVIAIAFTATWGLKGAAIGFLVANAFRYVFTTALGVWRLQKNQGGELHAS